MKIGRQVEMGEGGRSADWGHRVVIRERFCFSRLFPVELPLDVAPGQKEGRWASMGAVARVLGKLPSKKEAIDLVLKQGHPGLYRPLASDERGEPAELVSERLGADPPLAPLLPPAIRARSPQA